MALWRCQDCGTKFAVGLRMCPQCTSENSVEDSEEDTMPKTTVNNGPSDAQTYPPEQLGEGGEQGWDGSSSSTSTEKPPTSDETTASSDQSPVPTTESLSETGQTDAGSVPSTDGEKADPSDRRAEYETWTKDDLSAELELRDRPKTGTKAELVDRLCEYDDQTADSAPGE